TNEANSYHDFVQALVADSREDPEVFAWLLCDHRTLRRYGLGCVPPSPMPLGRYLRSGYLQRAATLAGLATAIGVDPRAPRKTVDDFNRDARSGEDSDFVRGSTAYHRYQGDPLVTPTPCLAPIEAGPFYAIRLVVGDIGTFAGLVTDRHTRVIGKTGMPIPGLHAVGNDAASVMGGNYPGAGITLG